MKTRRSYTLGVRAEAMAQTRRRIMQATIDLSQTRPLAEITLDAVAASAQVSVQTVLRRFGNRAGLMEAAVSYGREQVQAERAAPRGDLPAAVRILVEHYERRGDAVLLLLAQEATDPLVRDITDGGRAVHRTWVQDVCADQLPREPGGPDLDAVVDLLVVATDVYAWKLLRRDRGLARDVVEARMLSMVRAVLRGPECGEEPARG